MIKELKNKTTRDDMLGVFKLFWLVLFVLSLITSLVMAVLIS